MAHLPEGIAHFGKRCIEVTQTEEGATAHFADGTAFTGFNSKFVHITSGQTAIFSQNGGIGAACNITDFGNHGLLGLISHCHSQHSLMDRQLMPPAISASHPKMTGAISGSTCRLRGADMYAIYAGRR